MHVCEREARIIYICVCESITKCIINMRLIAIYHDNNINQTSINICIEYQSNIMNTLSTTLDSTALILSAS